MSARRCPAAIPATMASAVASPLERQFTTIAGVDEMTSSSTAGSSNITMTFDLGRNIDSAAVDVQTAIAAAMPLLPSTLTAPPSFRKVNPADQAILMLNLTSSTLQMSAVDDYAENVLAPRISMVNGVSQVNVFGAQKYAVHVQVDPNKLKAQDIGLNEVDSALQQWNVNQPTGQLFGASRPTRSTPMACCRARRAAAQRRVFQADRRSYLRRTAGPPGPGGQCHRQRRDAHPAGVAFHRAGPATGHHAVDPEAARHNVIEVTDAVRALLPSLVANCRRRSTRASASIARRRSGSLSRTSR